jgi:predicted transglutaminase-like cysteine proteinase
LLCSLFGDVYSKFNYTSDIEQYGIEEYRVSFAKAVKNNQDFRGDCDDFAYTMRDLLQEQGYDTELHIVQTYVMSGSKPHMVLRVREDDEYYMVDNRYPTIRTWENGMSGSMYTVLAPEKLSMNSQNTP